MSLCWKKLLWDTLLLQCFLPIALTSDTAVKEVKMSCESSSAHPLTSAVLFPHWRWCWALRAHTEPHTMFCKALENKVWLLLSGNYSRSCADSTLAICSDRGHISSLLALPSHSTDSLYLKRGTIATADHQKVFRWRTSSLESSHWQHSLLGGYYKIQSLPFSFLSPLTAIILM